MVKRANPMLRKCLPPLCAALGLVLTACSQQGPQFMPKASEAPATPAAQASATRPHASGPIAARRASTLLSTPVQSQAGQPLGTIQDIVFDTRGRATHLVIRHDGKLVPIPWLLAVSNIHDGILVLSQKRLDGAPGFAPGAWPDITDRSWSAAADAYWTVPIDSTSRSRARPTY